MSRSSRSVRPTNGPRNRAPRARVSRTSASVLTSATKSWASCLLNRFLPACEVKGRPASSRARSYRQRSVETGASNAMSPGVSRRISPSLSFNSNFPISRAHSSATTRASSSRELATFCFRREFDGYFGDARQDFIGCGAGALQRDVTGLLPRQMQCEAFVDMMKYRITRTEVRRDPHNVAGKLILDGLPHCYISCEIGAPESIDRLLRIADKEKLSRPQRSLVPCRRMFGTRTQQKDYLGLNGVGILKLIYEDSERIAGPLRTARRESRAAPGDTCIGGHRSPKRRRAV